MTTEHAYPHDPSLDLVLERTVDVPVEKVWRAWTVPAHLMKWFTPAPWRTVDCEIDLRPGGIFRTTMRSPEGQEFPSAGCYLEVVPNEKLVWTNALEPGYRPAGGRRDPAAASKECDEFLMTAVILMRPHGTGTRYTAIAIHKNPADRKRHEDMGFHHGWGAALDQLVAAAGGF